MLSRLCSEHILYYNYILIIHSVCPIYYCTAVAISVFNFKSRSIKGNISPIYLL